MPGVLGAGVSAEPPLPFEYIEFIWAMSGAVSRPGVMGGVKGLIWLPSKGIGCGPMGEKGGLP